MLYTCKHISFGREDMPVEPNIKHCHRARKAALFWGTPVKDLKYGVAQWY